jgi:AraC family transcriptional regulator
MEDSSNVGVNEASGPGLKVICDLVSPTAAAMKQYSEIAIFVPSEGAHARLTCAPFRGEQVVRELRAPLIAIIPPRCPHRLEWLTRAGIVTVLVSPGMLESISGESAQMKVADLGHALVVLDPVIRHLAEDFRAQLRNRHRYDGLYVESAAFLIASRLLRSYCDVPYPNTSYGGLPHHKRRRAVEFIESRLADAITVRDIAAAVDMSPCHFTRLFKRATGCAPYQYVTMARIERAKALLRERSRRQIDIALTVGYETQSHFATVFRRLVGLTPGAYRRLHAATDNPFVATAQRMAARAGRG